MLVVASSTNTMPKPKPAAARAVESLFEIGSRKCTPMALGNDEVARLHSRGRNQFRSDCGWRIPGITVRAIGENLQHVGEIHPNVDDRRTVLSKCSCKRRCFCDDRGCRMRARF